MTDTQGTTIITVDWNEKGLSGEVVESFWEDVVGTAFEVAAEQLGVDPDSGVEGVSMASTVSHYRRV